MTLRTRIADTLRDKPDGMTVRQLADTIDCYPLPSVRRTVREMEQADLLECILTGSSDRLHFVLL